MLGKFIDHCEDSLTAAVLTHILHLPVEVFWRLLRQACYTAQLPEVVGEPQQVDFWPSWNSMGTENAYRVVPDLFIRFADFDLIIEAKRWDHGMQNLGQWQRELTAYHNTYGAEGRPVRMIALGGIHHERDEVVELSAQTLAKIGAGAVSCPVHMCRWRNLLRQSKRMLAELERQEYASSQTFATRRILRDVVDLFAWHGFSTGKWFADFRFEFLRLSHDTRPHHQLLQTRTQHLRSK